MKNIAFVYSGDENILESLKHDRDEVERVLKAYGNWDKIINEELKTLADFQTSLNNFKDDKIENLFFYFSGHGHRVGLDEKELFLEVVDEAPRNMDEFTQCIFDAFSTPLLRLVVVLDTCYSGTYIDNNKIVCDSFEILTSSDNSKKSSANSISNMSRFTHYFCESLKKLHQQSKSITLQRIHEDLKEPLKPQTSNIGSPILNNGNMVIIKNTTDNEKLKLKNELKIYFTENNIPYSTLEHYARRILGFASIRISSEFDILVDELFTHHTKVLILILYHLDDSKLNYYLNYLLGFLNLTKADIKSFPNFDVDMKKEKSNLLIICRQAEGKDEKTVSIQIQEYRDNIYTTSETAFLTDLSTLDGKIALINAIQKKVASLKVDDFNILLEFILPFTLINEDIASWKGSNGNILNLRIIKRLAFRQELVRTDSNKKSNWGTIWEAYKKKKTSLLKQVMTQHIHIFSLNAKPYIRLDIPLCKDIYKQLVEQSACIVLAPLNMNSIDQVDVLCKSLLESETSLEYLLTSSTEYSIVKKVPYLLIWDNPNRIPLKKAEYKDQQDKSTLGT